ncbi:DNA methyltransferase, partial [Bacillus subtilis]
MLALTTKHDSRHVSNGADYMLVYASDANAWKVAGRKVKDSPDVSTLLAEEIPDKGARWWVGKPGVEIALAKAKEIWEVAGGDHALATKEWRAWMREFKKEGIASDAVTRFATLHHDGRPIRRDGNLMSPNPRENLKYDLPHPITGVAVRMHENGWRYSKDVMAELREQGLISFGKDETSTAYELVFLEKMDKQVVESVFVRDRNPSGDHLEEILGEKRFPNPKDVDVLARWIGLASPRDAVVLDFFGGSGTTSEAVMRLNAQDGGTRQSILVTNNEVGAKEAKVMRTADVHPGAPEWEARGVFERVCRPRISTVVTGKRPDGSKYSDGLEANVEFFKLTYLDPGRVRLGSEFTAVAPLMWLEGGAQGDRIEEIPEAEWALTDSYGVLFSIDALKPFAAAVAKAATDSRVPRVLFIITDS